MYFTWISSKSYRDVLQISSDIFRSPEVIKMTASQVSKFLYKSPSVPSCDTTLKRTKLGSRLCSDTASSQTSRADRLKHTAYIIQYHTIYTFGPVTFCTWKWRYCGKIMKNMQKCCPMRDSHDSMHTSQNAVCFKSPSALSTKVNSQAAVRIQTQPTSRGFRLNDICNAFASSPRTDAAAVGCIGSGAGASFAFTLKQVSSRDST